MKTLKTNILISAVALCIAAVLVVGENFWIGVSLLVVALISVVFVYVRISKQITP